MMGEQQLFHYKMTIISQNKSQEVYLVKSLNVIGIYHLRLAFTILHQKNTNI